MNYISCVIQILEKPVIELYGDNIPMVQFRVQLSYLRNKINSPIIINSTVWGNLAYDIINLYQINDYVLIEGYLLINANDNNKNESITLNIIKLYPFLFTFKENNSN